MRFNPVCHLNVFGASPWMAPFFLCLHPELPHQLLLFVRQLRQLPSVVGGGGRLRPDGVAHVADIADVAVDLVRHPALLLRGPRNLLVHLVNGADRQNDLLQHAD